MRKTGKKSPSGATYVGEDFWVEVKVYSIENKRKYQLKTNENFLSPPPAAFHLTRIVRWLIVNSFTM